MWSIIARRDRATVADRLAYFTFMFDLRLKWSASSFSTADRREIKTRVLATTNKTTMSVRSVRNRRSVLFPKSMHCYYSPPSGTLVAGSECNGDYKKKKN